VQKRLDLIFDLFGLFPWATKTEQPIVSVTDITEATIIGIGWVEGG